MNLLLQSIQQHVNLTSEEQSIVLSLTQQQLFAAKSILLEQDMICNSSFFVLEGILTNYHIDEHAVQHVLSFASDGWWMADMYSFLAEKPATTYIEALTQTTVLHLNRENRTLLFEKVPKIERYFRILIERSLVATQQRLLDNMALSATENYKAFQARFPQIKTQIAQKLIASYLGITPEFFSKMKKKLLFEEK